MNKEKTIFEKIIKGEIPSDKIYEDEQTFAFLDISPNTKGHSLVIPKKPFKNIFEMPEEEAGSLIKTVKKIAEILKNVLNADGINLVMNNGEAAGQEVFHAHIHVIPRYKNDDGYYYKKYQYQKNEKEEILEKIRKELI